MKGTPDPLRIPMDPRTPFCLTSLFPTLFRFFSHWKEPRYGKSEHLLPPCPPHCPHSSGPGRVLTRIKSSSREALKVQSSRSASFRSRSSRLPRAQCSSTRALTPGATKKPRQAATFSCRSSRICWGNGHLSSPQGPLSAWLGTTQIWAPSIYTQHKAEHREASELLGWMDR